MTSPVIWQGAGSNPVGQTPFGFFDSDAKWVKDAPDVASWCANKLGYPVLDVELADEQFYTCFEEAVIEYGSQVNQFNIRENMLLFQGMSTGSSFTQKYISGTPLPNLVRIARQYGGAVDVGDTVSLKRGSVITTASIQDYDLKALVAQVSESGKAIEIHKVYYESSPAVARYFDPYAGAGVGLQNLMTEFGFDGYSPAVSFVMLPAYEDLLRIQAIQFNDMIRKSHFSFEIHNNVLRLFPIPSTTMTVFFDYVVVDDKFSDVVNTASGSLVSDYSNVPYQFIPYSTINDVGRRWIFQYTFALIKELLGEIRSKYSTIPIPNGEVQLDGSILRQEAAAEKEELLKQLRETLDESGRRKQMEKQTDNAKNMQEIFKRVPLKIYIG